MSPYDYGVVAVYLCFIASIGLAFRKFSKDSSDFFRGGGNVLWWMVGATAFMSQFSSWTFTGAASKAYADGTLVLAIYFGNALGYFFAYRWSAQKFRQMRVVTPMEGVRDRFGRGNEQFFTWIWIPIGIFYAGIWLNAVSTFVSVVFGMNMKMTIVVVGLVVLLVAALGGAWAVIASDFMQMMILLPISLVAAYLSIKAVGGGSFAHGASTFLDRLPPGHLHWTATHRYQIVVFWVLAMVLKQFCLTNNMKDSDRFLCAKDSSNARSAALLASILFVAGSIIWFIPPMAAAILYPDLSVIPALRGLGHRIGEGAYVAIGLKTMPVGMIGLMVSAIFAATMSNMDTGLSKNSGIFIRNFYKPHLRKNASETEYLVAGKITSLIFGILIIAAALVISTFQHIGIFDVMNLFSAMVAIPFVLPLIWGIVIKRSPSWAGWSTVCIGFLSSVLVAKWVSPEIFRRLVGLDSPIKAGEMADYDLIAGTFANVIVGSLWFLGTTFFSRFNSKEDEARQQEFFERIEEPVLADAEKSKVMDRAQFKMLGRLSLPYGLFVMLLAALPNPLGGRLTFVFAGGLIAAIGAFLLQKGKAFQEGKEPARASVGAGGEK
jgi:Na+/proline symporter